MAEHKKFYIRTDEEIIEKLYEFQGILDSAAKSLGMSRQALQNRVRTNPEIKAARDDARETAKDFAEKTYWDEYIVNKDKQALQFYLSHQAKDRGWGDSQDINLSGGVDLTSTFDTSLLSFEEKVNFYEYLNKIQSKPLDE
jgi:hypothetical protein